MRPEAFSNDIEYEKPEQPPPTTPTRKPAGTGFCWAMISLTLATAFEVRINGVFLVVSCGWISGVVVVAMNVSLSELIITDDFGGRFDSKVLNWAPQKASLVVRRPSLAPRSR